MYFSASILALTALECATHTLLRQKHSDLSIYFSTTKLFLRDVTGVSLPSSNFFLSTRSADRNNTTACPNAFVASTCRLGLKGHLAISFLWKQLVDGIWPPYCFFLSVNRSLALFLLGYSNGACSTRKKKIPHVFVLWGKLLLSRMKYECTPKGKESDHWRHKFSRDWTHRYFFIYSSTLQCLCIACG